MIVMNEKMKEEIDEDYLIINDDAEIIVNKVCNSLIEVEECLIIQKEAPNNINIDRIINIYGDMTGFEASCNEFIINDFSDYITLDNKEEINMSLEVAKCLSNKLKSRYIDDCFYVVVSNDGSITNIRFYKYREGEVWININELEQFQEEALAVIIN